MSKKRRNGAGILWILVGLILCGTGLFLCTRFPGQCEYVIPAPEISETSPVETRLKELAEQLDGFDWTADLRCTDQAVSSEKAKNLQATVYAVSDGYFRLNHETLKQGDLLSAWHNENKSRVAVLTDTAANRLFPGEDPIGRMIQCGGADLKVIGVIAGGFRPGEAGEYLLYVPVTLADDRIVNAKTMEIRLRGSGREQAVLSGSRLNAWNPGGTLYDYSRLRWNALLPLWLPAVAAWFYLLRRAFRPLKTFLRRKIERTRADLARQYMRSLLPVTAGRVLVSLGVAALWAGGAYLLLWLIVQPMLVYTDWVTESLVDPQAITVTVKALLSGIVAPVVYRSRYASMGTVCGWLTTAGSLMAVIGIALRALRSGERLDK